MEEVCKKGLELKGDVKALETLIKSEFSALHARLDGQEGWLMGQSAERKKLEERVRGVEIAHEQIIGDMKTSNEHIKGKVLTLSACTAAGVGGFFTAVQLILQYLRVLGHG